jgi:hypothetical protein
MFRAEALEATIGVALPEGLVQLPDLRRWKLDCRRHGHNRLESLVQPFSQRIFKTPGKIAGRGIAVVAVLIGARGIVQFPEEFLDRLPLRPLDIEIGIVILVGKRLRAKKDPDLGL